MGASTERIQVCMSFLKTLDRIHSIYSNHTTSHGDIYVLREGLACAVQNAPQTWHEPDTNFRS